MKARARFSAPRVRATACLTLALAMQPAFASAQLVAPTAKTADGAVRGLTLESGVKAFRGIPFAAPPVGDARWKSPQPAAKWTSVRDADRFGNQCMQTRQYADMMFRNAGISEDCLYLNVWMPSTASANSTLPVLVYFYGGGFSAGDGSEWRYDGESMAKRGIVVVTLSYRLGIFGFFAHPELTAESPQHAAGNYGLMDQNAALRWVRTNIAAFGGDARRVTIAGESAGSMSVSAQIASPLSAGLFARAIGESGALFPSAGPMPTRAQTEENGAKFGVAAGATSLKALRALAATEVLDFSGKPGMPRFAPSVDGWFLPASPTELYAAGKQAHVALLAGWNSEEAGWRGLTPIAPTPDSAKAVLSRVFGDRAGEAAQHFPASSDAEATQSLTNLAGDRFIGYSTWKWLDAHAKTSGQPVYRYYYTRARPSARGASHSAEIEYAMGNLSHNNAFNWTVEDHKVSTTMQKYFENFIVSGDPNGDGLPSWPNSAASSDGQIKRMVIDVDSRVETEPTSRYRLLDQVFTKPRP